MQHSSNLSRASPQGKVSFSELQRGAATLGVRANIQTSSLSRKSWKCLPVYKEEKCKAEVLQRGGMAQSMQLILALWQVETSRGSGTVDFTFYLTFCCSLIKIIRARRKHFRTKLSYACH